MKDAIKELARQLSSEDPFERESCVLELAELEDPETAPLLLRALEDEAEPVRRWSAFGLAKLGRKEDAPILRRVLEKDPSTSVRIQAALGLVRLGEQPALDRLLKFLEAATLDARRDAAEALLSLSDSAALRSRLRPLLTGKDERSRAWAAGVLHALGEPEAFAEWRKALSSPESRRDAVSVVTFMREPLAARELLRLLAELPQEELDALEEEEAPLAELMGDALRLSGVEVLLASPPDDGLRSDLLILLGRYQHVVPDLTDDILDFLTERFPTDLGRELAQLLFEQERGTRGSLFINLATLFPDIAITTLDALSPQVREEVLDTLLEVADSVGGEDPALLALCKTILASPHGKRIERLNDPSMATRTIEEMPAIKLPGSITSTREMETVDPDELSEGMTAELEIPEGEELGEDGLGEDGLEEEEYEEEEWIPREPPEAAAVAWRALVVGGLLRRLALEERLARGKDPAAKEEILRLQKWMEAEDLFGDLGVSGLELFEAEPGGWSEEDRQSVAWSAEELQFLLWALKQGKLPPVEARAEAAPLLERLPLLKETRPFLDGAERRSLEEVEAQRDRWEVLLECARYESYARGILSEPEMVDGDEELDALLEAAESEGFDRKGTEAKLGKVRATVEGLRFWCGYLVSRLQEQGLLPGKPGGGLVFQGKRLPDMDDEGLTVLLALSHGRYHALEWLAEGQEVPPEDEDEPG
jgi:hypothetical protein